METESNLSQEDRSLPLLMYEVPGYGEPNIDHYLEARARSEAVLKRLRLPYELEDAADNPDEQYRLLDGALSSEDILAQEVAAKLISGLPEDLQGPLLKRSKAVALSELSSDSAERRVIGVKILKAAVGELPDSATKLIRDSVEQYLASPKIDERVAAAQMIILMPYGQQRDSCRFRLVESVRDGLSSEQEAEQTMAVELLPYCGEESVADLISGVLGKASNPIQETAAGYIKRLQPFIAEPLLRRVLRSGNSSIQAIGAEAATKLYRIHDKQPDMPSDIQEMIGNNAEDNLGAQESSKQICGAEMLQNVPEATRLARLIAVGMDSDNPEVQKKSVAAIRYLQADSEQSRSAMPELITRGLHSEKPVMQQAAVAVARHLFEPERSECMNEIFTLVRGLVQSGDEEDRRRGAAMLYYLNHPEAGELFSIVESDESMLQSLMYSRLYPYEPNETSYVRRVNFAKTGSGLTVLRGGTLDHKILIRHIKQRPFIGWMKAFEDYNAWLEAGFDYVPVEPIQSFSLNKNSSEADVSAGLLDIDLGHWLTVSGGRFQDVLIPQYRKIKEVLQAMGIKHGHPHMDNFFLRFPRLDDGTIDTHSLPHVYVGDFDKSQTKVGSAK